VIASLTVRLGISPREIETWDMETIRELMVVLTSKPRTSTPENGVLRLPESEQTQPQIEAALSSGFGKFS
jgi:hypothetical protein